MASPNLDKKQIEFWTVLFLIVLAVMVIVTLIDISTKSAIIEQATKFRLLLEGQSVGQSKTRANNNGTNHNDDSSDDVVFPFPSRLETRHASGIHTAPFADPSEYGDTERGPVADDTDIPPTD